MLASETVSKERIPEGTESNSDLIQLIRREEDLQSFCKGLLKSRVFRGFYKERRYVEALEDHRDIIELLQSESELERLLLVVKGQLEALYHEAAVEKWIGITQEPNTENPPMSTFKIVIWSQLEELAFGQYSFSIKGIKFYPNEIILKLKKVRTIENDSIESRCFGANIRLENTQTASLIRRGNEGDISGTTVHTTNMQIGLEDFSNVIRDWATSIKHSVYDFVSHDINKDNIKDVLQFLSLLVIALLTGTVVAIKYLGSFVLRFMFEFTRFTQVMTPIIIKIIDVVCKIIGGFYVLLAMIWKDTLGKDRQAPPIARTAIQYNKPVAPTLDYSSQKLRRLTDFERKYQ